MTDEDERPTADVHIFPDPHEARLAAMFGPVIPRMCKVVVDGRCIPGLYARDCGEVVEFCFSHNFNVFYAVPRCAATTFASGVASALAIGAGYACLSAETKEHPFAPKIVCLDVDGFNGPGVT